MRIAYLRCAFPVMSETFILEEVRCLIAAGHDVRVFADRAELATLQPKVVEHRLFDHITYCAPDERPLLAARSLLALARRLATDRAYVRGFCRNLNSARSPLAALREVVRGPRSAFSLLLHAARVNNLSLATNGGPPVTLEAAVTEFAPDVIHCPFLFDWEVSSLAKLQRHLMHKASTSPPQPSSAASRQRPSGDELAGRRGCRREFREQRNVASGEQQSQRIPFTVVVRSRDLHCTEQRPAQAHLRRWVLARASRIIAISKFNRAFVFARTEPHTRAAAIPGARHGIGIVHSGIDTTFFTPRPDVVPRPHQVVSVGRWVAKKGLHLLIEACALLRDRGVDVRCVIIGGGPQRVDMQRLVRSHRLESVVSLRRRCTHVEVRQALAESEVFALPCVVAPDGDRDMLPNSIKEAMSMQLPVVTSNISGIDELVTDGLTGLLVPPNSAEALALSLIHI